jgi:trehalose-6-phosphate synthase
MNLVAKEFVAARTDNAGVLVLSEMTGAAEELKQALLFNPYDMDAFARALEQAVAMRRAEVLLRMRELRRTVSARDVFRWSSDILDCLAGFERFPSRLSARAPAIARRDVRG